MLKQASFFILFLFLFSPEQAFSRYGSSNLGFSGYPESSCMEPHPPYTNDAWAWDNFKSEISSYKNCVNDYVEAARNDQEEINQKANQAVEKYNRFINSL